MNGARSKSLVKLKKTVIVVSDDQEVGRVIALRDVFRSLSEVSAGLNALTMKTEPLVSTNPRLCCGRGLQLTGG